MAGREQLGGAQSEGWPFTQLIALGDNSLGSIHVLYTLFSIYVILHF